MTRFSTIQEAITRELRDDIVAGRLAPGTRLVVDELAAKFEVSPMPVREALRQLGAERLLVIHSYRGATVSELSADEIREIFLMRELLEGEAARAGARRVGPEERRRLQALMNDMRAAVRDHDRWITADRAFHMALYQASGHPRLVALVGQLRQDIERYVRLYIALEHNIPRSMRRHQEILEACLAKDGAAARQATVTHLRETAELFTDELKRTHQAGHAAAGKRPRPATTVGGSR
ncbi:MAG TPA: GntR family transcriptional regulator [bacterium]|nr:GntR family transcriptional regulator [bacterium]